MNVEADVVDEPDDVNDDLINELIEQNADFRQLLQKSAASGRRPLSSVLPLLEAPAEGDGLIDDLLAGNADFQRMGAASLASRKKPYKFGR